MGNLPISREEAAAHREMSGMLTDEIKRRLPK